MNLTSGAALRPLFQYNGVSDFYTPVGSLPFTTKSRTIHGVVFIRDEEALSGGKGQGLYLTTPLHPIEKLLMCKFYRNTYRITNVAVARSLNTHTGTLIL